MAASAFCDTPSAASPAEHVVVKNTFIHLNEPGDGSPSRRCRKRFTVPSSARLASFAQCRSQSLESQSSQASTGHSSDCSAVSPRVVPHSPWSSAASTPLATPRGRWADAADDIPPITSVPTRTKLNAKAAEWKPSGAESVPLMDAEAKAIRAHVASVMAHLQATLDCCGTPVKVDVLGGEMSQCCVMLWIQPEHAWVTESILAAAKEAVLRVATDGSGVYVLGYQGQPFTPQPHGFSAMLAKMQDKSKACWEMYKKGCCCRGTACRWRHPQTAIPVNVVVGTHINAVAPMACVQGNRSQ